MMEHLGIAQGFTIYGGLFQSQEAATDALRAFDESGLYELHPDILPAIIYREDHGDFKLSVIARKH